MVTNAEEPEQKRGNREVITDTVEAAADGASRTFRSAVAGNPTARIRRGVLFAGAAAGILVPELAGVGIVALVLLAWTDQVVEL